MKRERIEELKTNGHTPGPWHPSANAADAVVCDEAKREYYNDDAVEYYGGHLVAESIATDGNRELIAAAPELLAEVVRLRKILHAMIDDPDSFVRFYPDDFRPKPEFYPEEFRREVERIANGENPQAMIQRLYYAEKNVDVAPIGPVEKLERLRGIVSEIRGNLETKDLASMSREDAIYALRIILSRVEAPSESPDRE